MLGLGVAGEECVLGHVSEHRVGVCEEVSHRSELQDAAVAHHEDPEGEPYARLEAFRLSTTDFAAADERIR